MRGQWDLRDNRPMGVRVRVRVRVRVGVRVRAVA